MGSKVNVTETFSDGDIPINGSPSKTILFKNIFSMSYPGTAPSVPLLDSPVMINR